jgi:hypothetical protein
VRDENNFRRFKFRQRNWRATVAIEPSGLIEVPRSAPRN